MKKLLGLLIISLVFYSFNFKEDKTTAFQDGDIIYQSSNSKQCEAVKIATKSEFSHCGIIFIKNGKTYVYEAVQPVKMTLLKDWISQGTDSKYVVQRLKNSDKLLTKEILNKMKTYGKSFNNKDYDLYFEWSDDKIYCSELVWKIYKNGANIELCQTKKLKDFNLNHPAVQQIMKERYGSKIPYNEAVVAPSQLYESALLQTIYNNF
ncbi:YiiX family permuted papain-like enzyme [Flavobacterium ardleyense]|uniref:YiiX family permuted papain-like enzyme n=1 Tax=Flavobacterium ardleyense TaxID=2038737 RepID=A0ABW5ZC16_9FLAO